MRLLELFAGIGGAARAAPPGTSIVAVDQDASAHAVYTRNHDHPAHRWNLATVAGSRLPHADVWWLSPPCQPFTVRGRARDVDDPRCAALLHVLDLIEDARPAAWAMENVPGFAGSRAHARVTAQLRGLGYAIDEAELCPTAWGWPNQRRRFYLWAVREGPAPRVEAPHRPMQALADFLDPPDAIDPDLYVSEDLQARYDGALATVDPNDPRAVAHCFTSAYGRSPVYAGGYLQDPRGLRRFSPDEILRLLGFDPPLAWPASVPLQRRYKLAGNSLSVPVVRTLLAALASVADPGDAR